jgi:hypothetical protein
VKFIIMQFWMHGHDILFIPLSKVNRMKPKLERINKILCKATASSSSKWRSVFCAATDMTKLIISCPVLLGCNAVW